MGTEVLKNKKSQYCLINTMSDKRMHDKKWISAKEAKAVLIGREFWRFMSQVIEIDIEFPSGYGSMKHGRFIDRKKHGAGGQWMLDNAYKKGGYKRVHDRMLEIKKKLKLDFEL